mgnify:CR=1 FL=1
MKRGLNILANMGPRYVVFRFWYEARRRMGLLKAAFPTQPSLQTYFSLSAWRKQKVCFFFEGKENLNKDFQPLEEEQKRLI